MTDSKDLIARLREFKLAVSEYLDAGQHLNTLTTETDGSVREAVRRKAVAAGNLVSRALEATPSISALEAEVVRLREALEDIAANIMPEDLDEDYYEAADFEDAYTRCIHNARAALEGQS